MASVKGGRTSEKKMYFVNPKCVANGQHQCVRHGYRLDHEVRLPAFPRRNKIPSPYNGIHTGETIYSYRTQSNTPNTILNVLTTKDH